MDWVLFVKFLHVVVVILWLGGGFCIALIASFAERANDDVQLATALRNNALLGKFLFFPALLATLVTGGILWWASWSLVEFWLLLGMGGFAASILIGMLILGPGSDRIAVALETEGPIPDILNEGRRLMRFGRFEVVILFSTAAVMILRPQPNDIGILAALVVAIAAGAVAFLLRGRRASPSM
ncbi:MAG: DUF2269 family protein [Pararhodobacter sp.]|nr:DUF2269 family protein [Pararhodobacter sp.]